MPYLIQTKSVCDCDDVWLKALEAKWACPDCRTLYPEIRKEAVDVVLLYAPDASAVNSVFPPGIPIARRDFMELFGHYPSQYLSLGRVFTSDGKLLDEFVTFVSRRRLLVRGGPDSTVTQCSTCGRTGYLAFPPFYVLRDDWFEQPLHESIGAGQLVLSDELYSRVKRSRWKGIYVTKLRIVDEPQDGLVFPGKVWR